MKYKSGTEFLNKLYKDMHMSDVVMHTAEKSDTPVEKIDRYLNRLEDVHNIAKTSGHKMDLLKIFYYKKYVIKELPENYVKLQQKIVRELGYGDVAVTDNVKAEMLQQVQKEQEKSLDSWIEYLCSDDALYPMWFKNYAFQGMIKLGKYDKENKSFKKRSSTTTEPFLDLNREILAKIYDTLSKEIEKDELTEEETKALENGESFNKLYIYYLTKFKNNSKDEVTDGIWVKYDQGSDSTKLCDSLQGKNTGWCTAGYETAKKQLSNGDFYVYYTKDKSNEYKNPRIAIRMNGHSEIGEVRGVGIDQNLEGNMIDIADKKLDEFPDKEKYKKKVNNMKLLTEIDKKVKNEEELKKDELIFLYEKNDKIDGFGYGRDPRIKEIKRSRNTKKDLSSVYDIDESSIATSMADFKNGDIIIYDGYFRYTPGLCLEKLRVISGDADFGSLETAEGLENLQRIDGHAYFSNLKTAEGLNNLQSIGGNADFRSLETAKGLNNLQSIGGNVYFEKMETAKGLNNLQSIGGEAAFSSLKTAEGLENLQSIGLDADFKKLETAKDLNNLQSIGRDAEFESLKTAEGLENLQSIGRDAEFESLKTAEGLNNLQSIGLIADFRSLESARGLEKLQNIGGAAKFESLKTAEGLEKCNKYKEIKANIEKITMLNEYENVQEVDNKIK